MDTKLQVEKRVEEGSLARSRPMWLSLLAGGCAGTSVDTLLFPLDTIKTRLQSKQGFVKSGGLKGVYRGLSSAVIGSAPSASIFFCTYEFMKGQIQKHDVQLFEGGNHMLAASCGEISACLVRVPTEVIKQRLQTNQYKTYLEAISKIYGSGGVTQFYRGFFTTIFREIPFCCIQFPIYEKFKKLYSEKYLEQPSAKLTGAALAGSISGGIAAGCTTPLDVIKTRIMLSTKGGAHELVYNGFYHTFRRIVNEEGYRALFKGIEPRVMWMSLGGAIFLGSYELVVSLFETKEGF